MATATQQKALGAFYTDEPVAQHLVRWSLRNASDTVLDPSSGGGVFLYAAIPTKYDVNVGFPWELRLAAFSHEGQAE